MEKAVYFKNKGMRIAGTIHMPGGGRRCGAVAMFHGFTGQRCEANFIFVELSRRLAEAGIASLRIDFRGSGESEGRFEAMTPEEEVSDALAAIAQLGRTARIDPRRLGVLGLSLGGLVAALAAGAEPAVKSVALWAAVARPVRVFQSMSTEKQAGAMKAKGRADFDGLYVGRAFVESLAALDGPGALAKSSAAVLIVHGTGDDIVPFSDSTEYLRATGKRRRRVKRITIKGADHTFSSVAWRNKALDATVKWFGETL